MVALSSLTARVIIGIEDDLLILLKQHPGIKITRNVSTDAQGDRYHTAIGSGNKIMLRASLEGLRLFTTRHHPAKWNNIVETLLLQTYGTERC